ncbi:MAG: GDSL family lipase [Flavobacteriaceae bacterium]|nr:GDSL family lipase [Flavobacteriaceae bacterium]
MCRSIANKIILFTFFPLTILSQNSFNINHLYPNKDLVIESQDEWGKKNYKKVIEEFKEKPLNFNDIVFLGNSITAEGENWSERLNIPNIKNRGIGGDTTDGVLARLDEIIYFKPKAVFLLIGINDLWNKPQTESSIKKIGNNVHKIANNIYEKSPESNIYVQTVIPVKKEIYKDQIISLNKIIKNNATKSKVYTVIDLYSLFVNDSGLIINELTYDGVHLNEKGYDRWVKFIKPIVSQL